MWRNGRGGDWDARITWYQGPDDDIRLKMDTTDGVRNVFPNSREEADVIWEDFRTNNQRPSEKPSEAKTGQWWEDLK
jgi:hypothetical protein